MWILQVVVSFFRGLGIFRISTLPSLSLLMTLSSSTHNNVSLVSAQAKEKTNDDDYHFRDAVMINRNKNGTKPTRKNEFSLLYENCVLYTEPLKLLDSVRIRIWNCYFLVLDEFCGSLVFSSLWRASEIKLFYSEMTQ